MNGAPAPMNQQYTSPKSNQGQTAQFIEKQAYWCDVIQYVCDVTKM